MNCIFKGGNSQKKFYLHFGIGQETKVKLNCYFLICRSSHNCLADFTFVYWTFAPQHAVTLTHNTIQCHCRNYYGICTKITIKPIEILLLERNWNANIKYVYRSHSNVLCSFLKQRYYGKIPVQDLIYYHPLFNEPAATPIIYTHRSGQMSKVQTYSNVTEIFNRPIKITHHTYKNLDSSWTLCNKEFSY